MAALDGLILSLGLVFAGVFSVYAYYQHTAHVVPLGRRGHRDRLGSMIFIQLLAPGIWTVVVSLLMFYYFKDFYCGEISEIKGLDTAMNVMGVSLTFILAQKTTTAYSRWWEGRGYAGKAAACLRELAMRASLAVADSKDPEMRRVYEELMQLLRIYYPLLRMHSKNSVKDHGEDKWKLRWKQDWIIEAEGDIFVVSTLAKKDVADLEQAKRPIIVLHLKIAAHLTTILEGTKSGREIILMCEQRQSDLLGAYHGVDKIANTNVPMLYDLLVTAALGAFILALFPYYLPYSYWVKIEPEDCARERERDMYVGFLVLTDVVAVFIFYGMNALAHSMEEPFGDDTFDLPLEKIEKGVEEDILCIAKVRRHTLHRQGKKTYSASPR
jgi:putative membrane protein